MKLTLVGGGSTYSPTLVSEVARRREALGITEICLMDVDRRRLDIVAGFSRRLITGADVQISRSLDLEESLERASFVVTTIRVGGLQARSRDKKICNALDLVGQETIGGAGLAFALRTIPDMIRVAETMAEVCPDAWLVNGTNPDGMVTRALLRAGHERSIGLCDIPYHLQTVFARLFGVSRQQVELDGCGLNHLTWYERVVIDGHDRTAELWDAVESGAYRSEAANIPSFRLEDGGFSRDLGLIPSPYLNYFAFTESILEAQKRSPRNRAEICLEIEAELLAAYADPAVSAVPEAMQRRGGANFCEVIADLIEAILLDTSDRQIVNVLNGPTVAGLPATSVVEVPCVITAAGATPVRSHEVPPALRSLVQTIDRYEDLVLEAVANRSRETLLAAAAHHPLIGPPEKAEALVDRLVEAYPGEFGCYAAGRRARVAT